jgi:epoxide hydrolase-like protein
MSSSSGLLTPDAPGSESSPRSAPNGLSRRSFLGAAAVATWTALDGGAMRPAAATAGARTRASTAAIRPFRIKVPQGQLAELRRRLAATRWSSRELVADRSQGVQLATIQAVADFWAAEHDWRRTEAKLNALPQFKTEIDGLDIHFIHVRSRHEGALPLIMTQAGPARSSSCSRSSARSPTRPRTADGPRTPSTWCCRPCPATASPVSRPRSAGTPAAPRAPGRS